MTDVASQLTDMVEELQTLRGAAAIAKQESDDLYNELARVEEKLAEANRTIAELKLAAGEILDGTDEAWLIKRQAEIHFKRKLNGGVLVTVRASGRSLITVKGEEHPKQSLLRHALKGAREKRG